jgi:hypothetical protein
MGWYLRDKRRLFLSMKTITAFKGYSAGQMHRIRQRNPETEERKELVRKYSFDVKMGYHVLRLIDQIEQILTTNDINLMRNKEEHKLMRSGLWGNLEQFDKEYQRRMSKLDDLTLKCSLSQFPNHDELKILLQEILEEHYGSMMNFNSVNKEQTEYISCKDVMEKLTQIENKIK